MHPIDDAPWAVNSGSSRPAKDSPTPGAVFFSFGTNLAIRSVFA